MTDFLLFVIICFLCSINNKLKKQTKKQKKEVPVQDMLPQYLGKTCEVTANNFMNIYIGILRDYDSEWIVLECEATKCNPKNLFKSSDKEQQVITRVLKIASISDMKEIK